MISKKRKLGDIGEDLACDYLKNNSYSIIVRNYNLKFGEIDIVARLNNETVFVEVKTSNNSSLIRSEENLTKAKIRKLLKAIEIYTMKNPLAEPDSWRVDLIAITLDNSTRKASLRHFKAIY